MTIPVLSVSSVPWPKQQRCRLPKGLSRGLRREKYGTGLRKNPKKASGWRQNPDLRLLLITVWKAFNPLDPSRVCGIRGRLSFRNSALSARQTLEERCCDGVTCRPARGRCDRWLCERYLATRRPGIEDSRVSAAPIWGLRQAGSRLHGEHERRLP